ncbi:MAG: GAF domain-containing protein [Phycisphaerae bacterium]
MPDDLSEIVYAALGTEPEHGLSDMLKRVAELMDCYGCILWQSAPGAKFTPESPQGHLFVLASWFPDDADPDVFVIHDIPLEKSVTGGAVLLDEPRRSNHIPNDRDVVYDEFLRLNQITRMLIVPVPWKSDAGVRVALNAYSRDTRRPFVDDDEARLRHLVGNLAELYRAVRDRISFHLVQKVERIVHEAEQQGANGSATEDNHGKVMSAICEAASGAFHSLETSVFLDDPNDAGFCQLAGTSWTEAIPKQRYRKCTDEGITGWVLEHGEAVRILNLANFHDDERRIQSRYPGIIWKDSLGFSKVVPNRIPQRQHDDLWPMSFIAAPVLSGDAVVGVIRCCTAHEAPYYFSNDDLELLQLIAAQISRCWGTWARERQVADRLSLVEERLRAKIAGEVRTFEDLSHELRGPLIQAERQVAFAIGRSAGTADRESLFAVRGLIRKAKRVALIIGVFQESAGGASTRLLCNSAVLDYKTLDRMLTEAAEDHEILADPGHPVHFEVDHDSYDVASIHRFRINYDLLEQAVSNLLDNAAKYSVADSTVRVHGGLTNTGNFHISVLNKGIKLLREHRTQCVERGWRSDEAVLCTDVGSGIGLWVVNRIMEMHGGHLDVRPTDEAGWTEFKLIFREPK